MKYLVAILVLFPVTCLAGPKKKTFGESCSKLWPAVVTVARSKHYHFPVIDNADRTGSVSIGGGNWFANDKRQLRFAVEKKGTACVLEVSNKFTGFEHHDGPDFIKRVEKESQRAAEAHKAK